MRKTIVLAALLLPYLYGQTKITPDCGPIAFTFTGTGTTTAYNNVSNGAQCINWTVTYSSTGFSAISLVFQEAPDSSGSPGSWSTFTAATGANPNTSTSFANSEFNGTAANAAWLRMNLASATGSGQITGAFYGYRNAAGGSGGGGGGGCTSPCTVVGPAATGSAVSGNPVYVAGMDAAGNAFPLLMGTSSVTISTSSSGNTQLVALSGSTRIFVTSFVVTAASAVTVQLTQGTGSNCGTSTSNLSGAFTNILSVARDYGMSPLVSGAGNAVCLNLSSGVSVTGELTYVQVAVTP